MIEQVKQDRAIRNFLRKVKNGQSINLMAWACEVLDRKTKMMSLKEIEKCFNLGFEG